MRKLVTALFWAGASLVSYTYLGYGVLTSVLVRSSGSAPSGGSVTAIAAELPPMTIIVPAYNEAGCIVQKLENTLRLDYPRDLCR